MIPDYILVILVGIGSSLLSSILTFMLIRHAVNSFFKTIFSQTAIEKLNEAKGDTPEFIVNMLSEFIPALDNPFIRTIAKNMIAGFINRFLQPVQSEQKQTTWG